MSASQGIKRFVVTVLATVGLSSGFFAAGQAATPRIPAVTPVPTTADSVPYGSDDADVASLGAFGYVQEEFFISGTLDGLPYATRILVRRPADPGRFSGIVLAESIRSTAHRSMWSIRDYLMRSGHAYVELGSNRQGILNLVKPSNPSRYAALSMPDVDPDARVFGHVQEIIAQGGMLLKSNLPAGPTPCGSTAAGSSRTLPLPRWMFRSSTSRDSRRWRAGRSPDAGTGGRTVTRRPICTASTRLPACLTVSFAA